MNKEKFQSVDLLPDPIEQFFLDSLDPLEHHVAKQYLHDIEIAAQELLTHHLDFEMNRLENPGEEMRLAIIYGNSVSFGHLRKDYKAAESKLIQLNPEKAAQVILHIKENIDQILSEMIYKKQLDAHNSNPFRPFIGSSNHIH